MSKLKTIALGLLIVTAGILAGCEQSSSASNGNSASTRSLQNADAVAKIVEITDANAAALLINQGDRSVVVAYSSNESSGPQTEQLETMAREANAYTGAVSFYRLDVAKNPTTWSNITHGRKWDHGPYFLLVKANPLTVGTVVDLKGASEVAVSSMDGLRLRAEIKRFFKAALPVSHTNIAQVDEQVLKPGLPTFIMAYRNKGAQNPVEQFKRFNYESQLYAGRVNFVLVDLDQPDISKELGFTLPKQDEPYYVVYDPKRKVGLLVNNPLLSQALMEDAIRSYFGPGHEPAIVTN
jgi:hypothetical protein